LCIAWSRDRDSDDEELDFVGFEGGGEGCGIVVVDEERVYS